MNQEFDNSVLDLVKQKRFCLYENMSDFKKCKKELLSKGRFYSSLTDRKTKGEEYEHVVNVWK